MAKKKKVIEMMLESPNMVKCPHCKTALVLVDLEIEADKDWMVFTKKRRKK